MCIVCFAQWKGDVLQLLDTPFAEKLDSKSFAYLTTYNSVPAFLANTTLQLFDNQTFMVSIYDRIISCPLSFPFREVTSAIV